MRLEISRDAAEDLRELQLHDLRVDGCLLQLSLDQLRQLQRYRVASGNEELERQRREINDLRNRPEY